MSNNNTYDNSMMTSMDVTNPVREGILVGIIMFGALLCFAVLLFNLGFCPAPCTRLVVRLTTLNRILQRQVGNHDNAERVAATGGRIGGLALPDPTDELNDDKERRAKVVRWLSPVQMTLTDENFPRHCDSERSHNGSAGGAAGHRHGLGLGGDGTANSSRSIGSNHSATAPRTNNNVGVMRSLFRAGNQNRSNHSNNIDKYNNSSARSVTRGDDEPQRIRIPVPGLLVETGRPIPAATAAKEEEPAVSADISDDGDHEAADGDDKRPPLPVPEQPSSSVRLECKPTMRWASSTCSICLMTYQVGERVAWSSNPNCPHCYHYSCIEEWLLQQQHRSTTRRQRSTQHRDNDEVTPQCPNCRQVFVVDPHAAAVVHGAGTADDV